MRSRITKPIRGLGWGNNCITHIIRSMKTNSTHSFVLIFILFGSLFVSGFAPTSAAASPTAVNISSCQVFPDNNYWNVPIDNLPVHPSSAQWINSIGAGDSFHMDFGSGNWDGGPIGIPYNIVSGASVTKYNVDFYYPDESDPGPYPLLASPKIEWGGDHHILTVDTDDCKLYELYDASKSGGQWSAGSGAIWDMDLNDLRTDTWTSADAAGFPILPGLARSEEVAAGIIEHALRFTANCTANYYVWPARHKAQHGSCATPVPFGARFRLKADYDISGFSSQAQVLLQAFKTYGIVLADNGSDWYVSGSPSPSWDNDQLHELDILEGADFEAVDTSGLMVDSNSAATNYSGTPHVYSITRLDANPTGSDTFHFQVYFSEPVTGVDSSDFTLTTTGDITGETVSQVTGLGVSYIVTATVTGGYGDVHLNLVDDDTIQDTSNNPLGGAGLGDGDFTDGEYYTHVLILSLSATPQPAYDGWVLESAEASNLGGTLNRTASTIRLGDDAADRQYRALLSFNTTLPVNAKITSVTLAFKYAGKTGTNPFSTHGNLLADVRKGAFSGNSALQLGDFNAKGTVTTYKVKVLTYTNAPVNSWYSQSLNPADFMFINPGGVTQFRLRFSKDDNNDFGADYLKIFSGNALDTDRPQLVIEYYIQ
jgi:hypothetical protein